ncbi:MAG: hypothetical protein EXR62_17170 [Chloroflexi bacterium]|nr:hypothetical protein [Chloroflexota bacterium]
MRIVNSQRQLFLDDEMIAWMENVQRVLHPPAKFEGNPVLQRQEAWEDFMPCCYGTVLRDPQTGQFRMWYCIAVFKGNNPFHLAYATSTDGIHWERPRLGLIELDGSKANNLIGLEMAMPSVIHTPWDPDLQRRYKMLAGESRGAWPVPWVGLFSPDGIRWQRNPEPIFPTGKQFQPGDEATAMWDPYGQRYVAFPKVHAGTGKRLFGRERRRSTGISFSDDFIHWTFPELVFMADEIDDQNTARRNLLYRDRVSVDRPAEYAADWYNMYVHPYEGQYIGLVSVFDSSGHSPYGNQDGTMHIQLTSSRDLRHWHRVGNRLPFIELGPVGSWDGNMVNGSATDFVFVGDEIWIYYTGYPHSHMDAASWPPERDAGYPRLRPSAVGLAKLRRDGFVSIEGDEKGGSLTTQPFQWETSKSGESTLYINASVTAPHGDGDIACELLDPPGDPIPGFTRQDCVPFTGDSVAQPITWQGSPTLPATGAPLRLRVHLKRAQIFSFWIA